MLQQRHALDISDAQHALGDSEAKTIRTRWVMCNTGDEDNPDIEARLVATELNTYNSDDFPHQPHRWMPNACSFPNLPADEPQGMGNVAVVLR